MRIIQAVVHIEILQFALSRLITDGAVHWMVDQFQLQDMLPDTFDIFA